MRRRSRALGAAPSEFIRRRRPRLPLGGQEQYILLDHLLSHVDDARDLARADGLGGTFGIPRFLWVDGDGETPTIGPVLTTAGAPLSGQPAPWELEGGSPVIVEEYDGVSNRTTAVPDLDPTIGQDIIIAALVRLTPGGGPGFPFILATANLAIQGYSLFYGTGTTNVTLRVGDGATSVTSNIPVPLGTLALLVGIIDGDGNTEISLNGGAPVAPAVTPVAGALSPGDGLGLGSRPNGASDYEGGILSAAIWIGNGIADDWIAGGYARVAQLAQRILGIYPLQGGVAAFTRDSAASWQDHDDHWHLASPHLPRAGDSTALLVEQQVANKVYNTINPQNVAGWATTGGAHAVVADDAALATALASCWGPAVHRFVPGGADEVIYGGALTGAGPAVHSLSVLLRGAVGGESVDVGLRDAGTGAVQNAGTVVCATDYQHVQIHGVAPADVDQQFCLDCDAGDTVYFIAPQLEAALRCTTPIPNWAAAAAAVRAWDDVVLAHDPDDEQGSLELVITPHGWSGAEAGGVGFGYLVGGGFAILYVQGGTWRCNLDGTTPMDSGVAPVDGVAHRLRVRWIATGLMSIEIQNAATGAVLGRTEAAYDGTLRFAGTWEFISGSAGYTIRDVIAYRNGSG